MGEKLPSPRIDPLAWDMRLSMLSAAGHSLRRETVLKPRPTFSGIENTCPKFCSVIDSMPSLQNILDSKDALSRSHGELLNWLSELKPSIRSCRISQIPASLSLDDFPPNFTFKVYHPEEKENSFLKLADEHSTFFALHGSSFENFHSILSFGLLGSMSKQGLFGEGVYLSEEASVCMNRCVDAHSWHKSKLGAKLGCMAVCEVVNHPTVIRGDSGRQANDSDNGPLPERYVLVKNSEHVILRYLLLYRTPKSHFERRVSAIYQEYTRFIWLCTSLMLLYIFYTLYKFLETPENPYLIDSIDYLDIIG